MQNKQLINDQLKTYIQYIQSTPYNSYLQGKSKKFELSGTQIKKPEVRKRTVFTVCTVNILITFTIIVEMSSEN